uniref:Glycosyltransferase-like protein n=1 Tax=Chlorobium chlorochromatii (strain CaD3) TaxID=340177 RepID=Q3ARU0_CHLCH
MFQQRKPRLLWANLYCLLDSSSGASISVREMLRQLAYNGYEVEVIGATIFDAVSGMSALPPQWKKRLETTDILELNDAPLRHKLLMTNSHQRDAVTALEEAKWYEFYLHTLNTFKPDVVWFYGGRPFDYLISDEAKHRGIPVAAYLVNGNYTKTRWCRDVDCIITDTQATADYYHRKNGLTLTPVGKFIDPKMVVAAEHLRRNVLFVNPTFEKGAALVVQIALQLEQLRPDIQLEVVESRGSWRGMVEYVSARLGKPRTGLSNVQVMPHSRNMRPLYSRARMVLAPSLWWESGSRVLAEAMLNAIPALVTDNGGNREMVGEGGIAIALPANYHAKPYIELLTSELLEQFVAQIICCYDDEQFYQTLVAQATLYGCTTHHISTSTQKLLKVFGKLIASSSKELSYK